MLRDHPSYADLVLNTVSVARGNGAGLHDQKTKLMPGRIMVLLVCSGAVLSALGWYQPFVDFAGAGASVPLLGFGHTLMKGVKEAVEQDGFLGLFTGGFQAGAAGTAAALIFGYLASLVFKPKMKK